MEMVIVSFITFGLGFAFGAHVTLKFRVTDSTELLLKEKEIANLTELMLELKKENDQLAHKLSETQNRVTEVTTQSRTERTAFEEKLNFINEAQIKLLDSFKALAAESLQNNNKSFLDLAQQTFSKQQEVAKAELDGKAELVKEFINPLKESLDKVDNKINELEKSRASAYTSLEEHLNYLKESNNNLKTETSNLSKALRAPNVRGRWGEIQLRRVVELAGMVDYCDFDEQVTDRAGLRPDMVIRLPNNKNIIIDSKAPLQAYLESLETNLDVEKINKLKEHAKQVKAHLSQLSSKAYWDQFDHTPEFVVLFLPGETFFSAALEQDPTLIEYGAEKKVILATPTTLISLLRAVAYGWKQEQVTKNAQEIATLGKTLYDRVKTFSGYVVDLKKGLDKASESYNNLVGSLETRVLPSVRKFKELGAGSDAEIEILEPVDKTTRTINLVELK